METQKNNERKVLVSVKVSTILAIIVSIIILAAVAVFIGNYVTAQQLKSQNVGQNSLEAEDTQDEVIEEKNDTIQMSDRNLIGVSSRSSSGRREAVQIIAIEEHEEDAIDEELEDVINVSTPIDEVEISIDMDLTVRTGLSKNDFVKLIENLKVDTSGFFIENAEYIYDVCERYSLNEIFFCGLISAESGWDIAPAHRNTHNYISLMSANGLLRFESVEDGLEKAAETLHERYLTPGGCFYHGSTLAGMKTRFCPASPTWVNLVYGRMEQIVK